MFMSVSCSIVMSVYYYCRMSVCCPYFIRTLYCCMFIMLHFKLLHYHITAYLCITHIPETMAGGTASVKGMGELLQLCVSRLRGFVCFFLLRRGEEGTNVIL